MGARKDKDHQGLDPLHRFFQYLQHERRYAAHTLAAYQNDLGQFSRYLSEMYEGLHPAEADHFHIRAWLVYLMEGGVSAPTIRRKISSLRSFFRFLRSRKLLDKDPMARVVVPQLPKRLPKSIRPEAIHRLFDDLSFPEGFEGLRDRALLEMLYGTGMRRSELIGLKVDDLDLEESQLRVLGKGNKERIIPLGSWLRSGLQAYLRGRGEVVEEARENALFVTRKGRALYPKKVYLIVRKYLSQVTTLDQRGPHVLRHTFATHLTEGGADLNAVKDLLGHASLAATQIYTHNSIEKLRRVYQQAHPKAKGK